MPDLHTNRLIHSASPYLLQHAHNPVDWYPWGEEAFEKAKKEDKLVLVSIGYSACHWCHVMEHECFEDEETAELMNARFVCIKVDREERPDVDQIYMNALQLISGQGGWPLNMFTLPDGKPLHGGTYFPRKNWQETLTALDNFYKTKRSDALQFAEELTEGVRKTDQLLPASQEDFHFDFVRQQVDDFKDKFDLSFGGYQWSPKFPLPNNWLFFLHYTLLSKDPEVEEAVFTTLVRMAEGGIYDQLGGGFARYSTDAYWKAPHFEKMLYDNGQLMSLYAEAYKLRPLPLFRHVLNQTASWIEKEMTDETGAFYSAQDADSEGVEGKYYIWSRDELKAILGEDELIYNIYYNVQPQGNWEHGSNILYKTLSDEELEKLTRIPREQLWQLIGRCNKKLLAIRESRIKPGLDDKTITSWNATMIKGFADAFAATAEKHFLEKAERNAAFLLDTLWKDGILYRIYKKENTSVPGFAEDYALLCEALIRLYEVSFNEAYLLKAQELMQASIRDFYEEERGTFYFSSQHAEQLVARKTDLTDDVIPSSNSVFAKCMFYLSFYFAEPSYREKAERLLRNVMPAIHTSVVSYSNWLDLAMMMSKPFYQVVCSGPRAKEQAFAIHARPLCNYLLAGSAQEATAIPLLEGKYQEQSFLIYVCRDGACELPVNSLKLALARMNF